MWGNHRKTAANSAAQAKERLQVVITRERAICGSSLKPELLDALRNEIISVIRKYADIRENDIRVHLERDADKEVLEVSVVFPD